MTDYTRGYRSPQAQAVPTAAPSRPCGCTGDPEGIQPPTRAPGCRAHAWAHGEPVRASVAPARFQGRYRASEDSDLDLDLAPLPHPARGGEFTDLADEPCPDCGGCGEVPAAWDAKGRGHVRACARCARTLTPSRRRELSSALERIQRTPVAPLPERAFPGTFEIPRDRPRWAEM